jgi:hypothetical protein
LEYLPLQLSLARGKRAGNARGEFEAEP